jgi:rare lipoprotein A
MKWNASAIAALLLLAGCGGDRSLANLAPELPGSVAARNSAEHTPAIGAFAVVPGGQAAPGASYAVPGSAPPPPAQDSYADPAANAAGPRGSSQRTPGEQRYDEVGYAGVGFEDASITGLHASLAPDTLVEVTSLENGRTIVVLITGAMAPGTRGPIDLSSGAARALGHDGAGPIAVRVRKVAAGPGDMLALRSGRSAAARPDTPPILLNALRKHLGAPAVAAAPAPATVRPTTPPRPVVSRPSVSRPAPAPRAARPASGRGFYVQVAALSNARNAQSLAQRMGGFVKQGGGLHRVQLGPFATKREADAARAGAARAGYGDARVIAVN